MDNDEGMAYSCAMMLANSYKYMIEQAIPNPENRTREHPLIRGLLAGNYTKDVKVTEYYTKNAFRGPSGPITLDRNGDRKEG